MEIRTTFKLRVCYTGGYFSTEYQRARGGKQRNDLLGDIERVKA
jgi:hypothetical protein